MIQPATPSLSAVLGLPSGPATQAAPDLPDSTDFQALLALEAEATGAVPGDTCRALPGAAKPASPASPTATSGKPLPPAVPVDVYVPPEAKMAEPVPVMPVIAGPGAVKPAKPIPVMPVVAVTAVVKPAEPVPVMPTVAVMDTTPKDRPAPLPETKDGPVPVSDVLPGELKPIVTAPSLVTLPLPAALPGIPQPVAGPPVTPAPRRNFGPQRRTVSTLPLVASLRAQGRSAAHRAEAVATAPAAPLGPQTTPPAPGNVRDAVPAEEVRIALALPRLTPGLVLARDALRLAAAPREIAIADALTIDPALTQPAANQGRPAPLDSSATPAPLRPHDFAALIDRITAARDAVSAQAVTITLEHQEFGPVRLNFRSEEAGLAVSMTSPDPDFARAAAATPAPVVPVTQAEPSNLGQSRGDGQSAQSHSQSQSQAGSSGQQRRDQAQQAAQPAPRSPASRAAPDRGIFA